MKNIKFISCACLLLSTHSFVYGSNSISRTSSSAIYDYYSIEATDYIYEKKETNLISNSALTAINYPFEQIKNFAEVKNEDGTKSSPFLQDKLITSGIKDPNAYVASNTTTYDLRWGTPDKKGSQYALDNAETKRTFEKPLSYMGFSVKSSYSSPTGPTFYTATPEVKAAWEQGWTGKGVNILLVDAYADQYYYHGVTTMMITDLIAPGASKYGLHYGTTAYKWKSPTDTVKDINGIDITSKTSMGVVNASFGFNYWEWKLNPEKSEDIKTAFEILAKQGHAEAWKNVFNGTISVKNLNVSDAVIVQGAANDSASAANQPYVYIYATDPNINPRLLVVGATESDGTLTSKTSLANYSNKAGDDPIVADRFLVANGNAPYDSINIGDYDISNAKGTSYAAPRVAGYVAILRQKFPNLNAEKSASILLDTARYDTLTCYPNCPVNIYGKGEASLSRALAPVGNLR
jgi:hypothetical protein